MRCNTCSRLYVTKSVVPGSAVDQFACACGSRVWYWSKITLVEWFLFKVGILRDADMTNISMVDMPLAGHPDKVSAAMEVARDVERSERSG